MQDTSPEDDMILCTPAASMQVPAADSDDQPSLLESLPAELRNQIYELALFQPDGVMLSPIPHNKRLWMTTPTRTSNALALTVVSKSIRRESLPLFYGTNTFTFERGLASSGTHKLGLNDFDRERRLRADALLLASWLPKVEVMEIRVHRLVVSTSTWLDDGLYNSDSKERKAWRDMLGHWVKAALLDASGGLVQDLHINCSRIQGCASGEGGGGE